MNMRKDIFDPQLLRLAVHRLVQFKQQANRFALVDPAARHWMKLHAEKILVASAGCKNAAIIRGRRRGYGYGQAAVVARYE